MLTLLVKSVKQSILLLLFATDFCFCSFGDLAHLVELRPRGARQRSRGSMASLLLTSHNHLHAADVVGITPPPSTYLHARTPNEISASKSGDLWKTQVVSSTALPC